MRRFVAIALFLVAVAVLAIAVEAVRFANGKLDLPVTPFEFTVERGSSLKALSRKLTEAKLLGDEHRLWLLGRINNQATGIQAGTYRLDAPITPNELLQKLNDGDVVTVSITFVEGITFREMREHLATVTALKVVTKGLSDRDILRKLNATETHPEGLFFPDTYRFAAGTTDLDILRLAYQAMQKKLAAAWAQREDGLPYKSPYEALIMASIVEKETGRADERPLIASVFVNRLRIPMRLQTDPTVIYGMGPSYDGNIRKRDLTADTPYNTYTRDGLPPTPIAMPGWGSLIASVKPESSDRLYFVATRKGDGSHHFSKSLEEHNRAVARYQLGQLGR